MRWKIAEAKTKFSDLLRKAEKEPQFIYNRDKMVAVVMSRDEYVELEKIKESGSGRSLASALNEFSSLCAEESYTFEAPVRKTRRTEFP